MIKNDINQNTKKIVNRNNQEIIQMLSDDNPAAFETLFLHYYPKVKLFLIGFLKDEESAQDIVQDVFLKLWQRRKELDSLTNFNAFLFRCAKNEMLNYLRKQYIGTLYIEKEIQKEARYNNDPESEYVATELSSLVKSMVEKMPSQRKIIFRMSREEGLSSDEIAQRLNINKRTVENHLSLALRTIRENILTIMLAIQCFKL